MNHDIEIFKADLDALAHGLKTMRRLALDEPGRFCFFSYQDRAYVLYALYPFNGRKSYRLCTDCMCGKKFDENTADWITGALGKVDE